MSFLALIDCNNFFVSCERLFRPDLAEKSVVVLSSNDGCVISRSEEAKALGIKMGEPFFKIRERCESERIAVFSSNFDLYRDLSRRVMETLRRFSDQVEVYSVDEAFLHMDLRSPYVRSGGVPRVHGVLQGGVHGAHTSTFRHCEECNAGEQRSNPGVKPAVVKHGISTWSRHGTPLGSTVCRADGSEFFSDGHGYTPGLLHPLRLEASRVRNDEQHVHSSYARQAPQSASFSEYRDTNGAPYRDLSTDVRHDTHLYCVGTQIRTTVLREVGIPVSVGVAPTKTLAKVATHFAKERARHASVAHSIVPTAVGTMLKGSEGNVATQKGCCGGGVQQGSECSTMKNACSVDIGVCVLSDAPQIHRALDRLPIEEIWGVGFRLAPKLKALGIDTAGKLIQMDDEWIRKRMSIKGLTTVRELRGMPCYDVGEDAELRKTLLHSQSFGKSLYDVADVRAAVAYHARKVAETLRTEKAAARSVSVVIRTSRHREKRYAAFDTDLLPTHTNSTFELVSQALAILTRIYRPGFPYAKAGVQVSDIVPEGAVHPETLFGDTTRTDVRLMQTLDELRSRFGPDVVRLGAEGMQKKWSARHERLSPRYTTAWSDVPTIQSTPGGNRLRR